MERIRKTAASLRTITGGVLLYSYSTPVAAHVNGQTYRTAERYSVTTSRHVNEFIANHDSPPAIVKPPVWFFTLAGNGELPTDEEVAS